MSKPKTPSPPSPQPSDHDDGRKPGADSDLEKTVLEPVPEEDELWKPKTFKFWLTMLCNFLALFLVALDRTIISTAVPRISDEFNSLGDIGWYGSSYMLTTSCAQLVYGKIYKHYDTKWVFLTSMVIFEAGSAICGAAPSSTIFIIGRAIAGLGSAGIFSGCMLIMIPMVPLHRRPMFQGLFGMVFGMASVTGPLIGGGLTTGASWRWCFYINLPIGGLSFLFFIFFWNPAKEVHEPAPWLEHVRRLDPLGIFLILPGVVSLLLALEWGGSSYVWNSWRIITLFAVFAFCIFLFAASQVFRPETAMIPTRVIGQRSVAFGTAFTFFLAGSMLMLVYYLPIWFQTVLKVDAITSGVRTLPLLLSLVVSSILSGIITQKTGYYVPSMLLCPCLMIVGEGLMTTFDRTSPSSHWIAYQFLAGFGLGFGMQTSSLAIQAVLPKPDIPTGVAINFFVQQLGGAVFTSVGQSILSNLLVSELAGVPGVQGTDIVGQGVTGLESAVPPEYVDTVVHAYNYACQRIFLAALGLAGAALLCACGMEWRNIKKGRNSQSPPASNSASGRKTRQDVVATDEKLAKVGPEREKAADVAKVAETASGSSQASDSERASRECGHGRSEQGSSSGSGPGSSSNSSSSLYSTADEHQPTAAPAEAGKARSSPDTEWPLKSRRASRPSSAVVSPRPRTRNGPTASSSPRSSRQGSAASSARSARRSARSEPTATEPPPHPTSPTSPTLLDGRGPRPSSRQTLHVPLAYLLSDGRVSRIEYPAREGRSDVVTLRPSRLSSRPRSFPPASITYRRSSTAGP